MRARLQWIYGIGQIENHDLVYGTYIGNGDSSSYKNLVKADPYNGVVSVRKEECLCHVQKRTKKRLRKTTKEFKRPDAKADGITHLYTLVIVQHRMKVLTKFARPFRFYSDTARRSSEASSS